MLQKEKTQLNGQNCYLLGKSNHSYGLVYLLETKDAYKLIYRDEQEHINEINIFGGYRLYEPSQMYDMLSEFVISDNRLDTLMKKMYIYHAALGARNISGYDSRFSNVKHHEHYKEVVGRLRREISEMLTPEGSVSELDELKKQLNDLQKAVLKEYIKKTANSTIHKFLEELLHKLTDENDLDKISDLIDAIGDEKLHTLDIGKKVNESFKKEFSYYHGMNLKKESCCKLVFTTNNNIIEHIEYFTE